MIEAVSAAVFLIKQDKLPFLKLAIRKLDTIKILLLVGWENKFIMNTKYADLSLKLDKIGKMLGGWKGKLEKENSSSLFKREEKWNELRASRGVVGVPVVVEPVVVPVPLVAIPVEVTDIEVAVRVAVSSKTPPFTPLSNYFKSWIVFGILNALIFWTKYFHFLE